MVGVGGWVGGGWVGGWVRACVLLLLLLVVVVVMGRGGGGWGGKEGVEVTGRVGAPVDRLGSAGFLTRINRFLTWISRAQTRINRFLTRISRISDSDQSGFCLGSTCS